MVQQIDVVAGGASNVQDLAPPLWRVASEDLLDLVIVLVLVVEEVVVHIRIKAVEDVLVGLADEAVAASLDKPLLIRKSFIKFVEDHDDKADY